MVEVAVSLLNADEEKIVQTLYDIEAGKADYFHIDVMDGKLVEDNTVDKMLRYTEHIKQISQLPIDVHLMVDDVEKHVKEYLSLDVNCISFQVEAYKNENRMQELLQLVKDNNTKVGLAIAPRTSIDRIFKYIPYIHKVIVMTVEPGKGGQEYLPEMTSKIFELNKFIYENGYDVDIEVDGGINGITAKEATDAGANILVAGSYVLGLNNYQEAIRILKQKE